MVEAPDLGVAIRCSIVEGSAASVRPGGSLALWTRPSVVFVWFSYSFFMFFMVFAKNWISKNWKSIDIH